MNNVEKFTSKVLNDKNFIKKFESISNKGDMLKIAKASGFDFTKEELKSKELNDMLESIAGGKKDSLQVIDTHVETNGNDNKYFTGGDESDFLAYLALAGFEGPSGE